MEPFNVYLELGDRPVEAIKLDFKDTTHEITKKVAGLRRRKQFSSMYDIDVPPPQSVLLVSTVLASSLTVRRRSTGRS